MFVLGLLLLAACGVFAAGVVMDSTQPAGTIHLWGQHFSGLTIGGTFLVGCICGLVAAVGIMLMIASLTRWRTRRIERRTLVTQTGAYPVEAPARAGEPVTTVSAPTRTGRHRTTDETITRE